MRAITEVLFFGIEGGSYGSETGLTPTNAVPAFDIDFNPEFDRQDIKEARGFAGGNLSQITSEHQILKAKMLLRGSGGAPDTPTINDVIFRLAGYSRNVVAGTSVDYTLVDTGFEHGTCYYYIGEVLHKLTGVRISNAKFVHNIGGLDYIEALVIGLPVPVSEATPGNVDWSTLPSMLPTNSATFSTLDILGHSIGYETLEIMPGQEFEYVDRASEQQVDWVDRKGSIKVSVPEPKPSVFNFWEKLSQGAIGAFNYQRGKDVAHTGNIFAHSVPSAQFMNAKRNKRKGRTYLDLEFNIFPQSKNTDITTQTR